MGLAIIIGSIMCCIAVALFERGNAANKAQQHSPRDRYAVDPLLRRVHVPGVQ